MAGTTNSANAETEQEVQQPETSYPAEDKNCPFCKKKKGHTIKCKITQLKRNVTNLVRGQIRGQGTNKR